MGPLNTPCIDKRASVGDKVDSEVSMRFFIAAIFIVALTGLGCPAAGTPALKPSSQPAPLPEAAPSPGPQPVAPETIPPERRVWAFVDGVHRVMDMDQARAYGLTIVDLSDDWVPYIFWSQTPGMDDYKKNNYMQTYIELANDKIDVDGVALRKWQRNYLEVYGIPPTLGVLRRRLLEDEQKECYQSLNLDVFKEGYYGPVRIVDPKGSEREQKRYFSARGNYKKALRKARVRTLDQLLTHKKHRRVAEKYRKYHWRHRAIRAMQRRLACEGMFGRRTPRIKPGIINWTSRSALRLFEKKHDIYGWGMIFQNTANALGRRPAENHYESLKRVLTERVISATGILEDGTAGKKRYRSASGERTRVRNLVEEFSEAIIQQMGLTSADKAMAFLKRHSEQDLSHFWVAVKLPSLPEYYADQMELSVVVDRGDIWYELPFDDKGKRKNQPRSRFPHLTLFVTHNDQKIPLVRWKTTIGGWQPEMRHDQEYYKYKISDVGPRIWRRIVAGPVWVPPKNTPSRDMVKIRPVRNKTERIVAHQSFGPGYASAYGLVAAFHVTKAGRDNQVRTHGSGNYMSIVGRKYSHGCHRLFNYRAVRIFSFVLRHRTFERRGQSRLSYANRYEHRGEDFHNQLDTRGYYYILKPPVEVMVREGNIKGSVDKPIEEYVKKPTAVYNEDLRALKGKAPSGAPRIKTKKPKNVMSQPQNL